MKLDIKEVRSAFEERLKEVEGTAATKRQPLAIIDKLLSTETGAKLLSTFVGNG